VARPNEFNSVFINRVFVWHPGMASSRGAADRDLRVAFEQARASLAEMSKWEENWDGEGASAFAPEAIKNAHLVLNVSEGVLPAPEVSPNPNGTITFEWFVGARSAYWEVGRTTWGWFVQENGSTMMRAQGQITVEASVLREAAKLIAQFLLAINSFGRTATMAGVLSAALLLGRAYGTHVPPLLGEIQGRAWW
jgi:hypothetical protein